MAGIIAQITRANRARIDNKKSEIAIGKCMYDILPFDPCFDPNVSISSTFKSNIDFKYLNF